MEEKILLHYVFENMLKYLALAMIIMKNVSLLDQTGQ